MCIAHGTGGGVALSVMQPRFAALLFVLGLADLAYVNLGLGHEVFGDGSGAASGAAGGPTPAPAPAPRAPEAARTPSPPPAPAPAPQPPPVTAPSGVNDEPSAANVPAPEPPAASLPAPDVPAADVPTPGATDPSALGAAAPAPEEVALPAPTAPVEPARDPAPPSSAPLPARREASPSEPAPGAVALPSTPRPAQAGFAAAPVASADTASGIAAAARPRAEPEAPVASAAALPDTAMTVTFPDTASSWLTDEAHAQLMALAAKLRANPEYRIHIVGHADARGSREFNRDLGARRARTVTELLARAGVSRQQLLTDSRGEDAPLAVGDSERVWAANRRVEISIGTERSPSP